MKKTGKILSCIAASLLSVAMTGVTAFADDYSFDMEKSKQTHGGGQAYMSFTRLDNERRDRQKFNPLWITPETTVEIDYESEGEYDEYPIQLVLQSWVGALVDSTEDKWVQIPPTTFDDNHATWSYDTIVSAYGDDFSDVYAIVIEDSGKNSLLVKNVVFADLDVPEEEQANVSGGILTVTDTEPVTTDLSENKQTSDDTTVTSVSKAPDNTEKKSESVSKETGTEKADDNSSEDAESGISPIVIIAVVGGAVLLIVIGIIIISRRRNHGWH